MKLGTRQLRTPEERVGMLPNASLPPPCRDLAHAADEELLVRGLRDGDEDALALALDRLFPAMLRTATCHVRSRAAAEDVVQDSWLAAIDGFLRFGGRSSVRTWLFRILRNIARTRGRRDARTSPFSEMNGTGPADPLERPVRWETQALWVTGTDPEAELLSTELAERIESAIAALPPRQREVIVLRDVEGWPADEVCNTLGITQTNQRVLLHRARSRVRTELEPYLAEMDGCGDETSDVF
jgi:RNA polymerase sigma-70 factor, ECF subfamily